MTTNEPDGPAEAPRDRIIVHDNGEPSPAKFTCATCDTKLNSHNPGFQCFSCLSKRILTTEAETYLHTLRIHVDRCREVGAPYPFKQGFLYRGAYIEYMSKGQRSLKRPSKPKWSRSGGKSRGGKR